MQCSRFISALLLATAPALYAQYQPPVPNPYTATTPSYQVARTRQSIVARISAAQGDVNIKRGDTGEVVPATANVPLGVRDHLQTSAGSRAEVEFDSANLVRLAPNTDVGMARFEYRRYRLQFRTGTILYRISRDSDAQVVVEMPFGLSATPQLAGEYRISVLDDGTARITVRSGRLDVYSPHGTRLLLPGQTRMIRSDPGRLEFRPTYEAARDHFDDWSAYRDRELGTVESYYGDRGWKRFGDPGGENPRGQSFRDGEEHSGWHNFGQAQHSSEEPQR